MGNKAPAFQFYHKDWISSPRVRDMSLAARGLYIDMLAWSWEGPLPNDPVKVARRIGAQVEEVQAVWEEVRPCFGLVAGGLVNEKVEKVRAEQGKFRRQMKELSERGNEVRWGKRSAKPKTGKANLVVPYGIPSGIPSASPSLGSPASALASEDLDLDPREREKLLTPDRIGPDRKESQEQVATDKGEEPDLRPPTSTEIAALATLFQDYPERHAVRDHNTSAAYGSQAYAITIKFLAPLFPDARPGAGLSKEVTQWTGQIPIRDCAIAVREITRRLYPSVNGGRERTWNELDQATQKRITTHEFNAMLPVGG